MNSLGNNIGTNSKTMLIKWYVHFYKNYQNCYGVLFFTFFLWPFGIWKIYNYKANILKYAQEIAGKILCRKKQIG